MLKKIFGHSFMYTLANNVPLMAGLVTLPLITPYLTPRDYGVYGLVLAYIGAITVISTLGLQVFFQNTYFKNKENYIEDWKRYFGLLLAWRIPYALLAYIILYFTLKKHIPDQIHHVLLIVVSQELLFGLTRLMAMKHCQYEGRHSYVYTTTFIASLFTIGISFTCIYFLRLGYLGWIYGNFAAALIQFILFGYWIHIKYKVIPVFIFSKEFIKKSLRISFPLIPHDYSNYLLETSDRVVLDLNKIDLSKIGEYNIAYSFSNYFQSFNRSLNTILSPIYFKLFASKEENTSQTITNITLLWFFFILFAAGGLGMWSKEIFLFLYRNPDLNKAYKIVPFLMMGMLYRPFYVASVDRAIYNEKTKQILKVSLIAGLLNVMLNVIFIPHFGIKAAIVTTFLCYTYLGFSGFFIKGIKEQVIFNYSPFPFMLIIIASPFLINLLMEIQWEYKLIISIGFIILAVILYQLKLKKLVQ